MQPVIIPRSEHTISRRDIDPDALKVLYRLYRAGHVAYLVGGGVRDLLLGIRPKDFDIATDAHPQKIRKIFRNCVLVGRRFRLAHVRFGNKVIEVSTFRRMPDPNEEAEVGEDLLIRRDNTFGSPEDDALRRDFTVNALFYDIGTYSLIDFTGGLADLEDGLIRSIGDADVRFQEDPVRMIRAVKFAARLEFDISDADRAAITTHRAKVAQSSISRLLEEIFKLLRGGASASSFRLLADTGILEHLLPEILTHLKATGGIEDPENSEFYRYLFALDDLLHHEDHPGAANSLLLAVLLIPMLNVELRRAFDVRDPWEASPREVDEAFETALRPVLRRLTVSRRDCERLRQALLLQPRLTDEAGPTGKRGQTAIRNPQIHEAAELLWIASKIHDDLADLADDWAEAVESVAPMPEDLPIPRRRGGRNRRRT